MENANSNSNSNTKKFRFQGRYMFITIPEHHGEDYIDFICNQWPDQVTDWIISRETGESGYKHSHVAIMFKKKICFQRADRLDYKGHHPCIESIRTTWADAVHYIAKDGDYDSSFDLNDLNPIQKKIDRVLGAETLRDALKEAKSCNEIMPIMKLYENRTRTNNTMFEPLKDLREWQAKFLAIIEQNDSDRAVFWLYDKAGGQGKTSLMKHMKATREGVCVIPSCSTADNINRAICNYTKRGPIKTLLINLTRGVCNYTSIYDSIEQVKDGWIFVGKYDSDTIEIGSCTVVIFSNALPDTKGLTRDRWNIFSLEEDGDLYPL